MLTYKPITLRPYVPIRRKKNYAKKKFKTKSFVRGLDTRPILMHNVS